MTQDNANNFDNANNANNTNNANSFNNANNQEQYREGRLETESDLTCGSKHVIFKRGQTDVSPNWRKQNCILQT